jgi:hypothetical protein
MNWRNTLRYSALLTLSRLPSCHKRFGSFGMTKPPTTLVGVMRPITPHSRRGCRQPCTAENDHAPATGMREMAEYAFAIPPLWAKQRLTRRTAFGDGAGENGSAARQGRSPTKLNPKALTHIHVSVFNKIIILEMGRAMNIKSAFAGTLLSAAIITAFPACANTLLTVGDTLKLDYQFSSLGNSINSTTFTYTGAGQTVLTQNGITTLDILGDGQIAFKEAPGCGTGCFQSPAAWNGPVLFDLSNSNAFSNWSILSDTVGITSSLIAPGEIGVNWQGAVVRGEVDVGVAVTPLPASWTMMLSSLLIGLGFMAYQRGKRNDGALASATA